MKDFLRRKQIWRFLSLLALDGLVFGLTDATTSPSFVIIIGFILLVLTLYRLIYGLVSLARLYGIRVKRQRTLSIYLTAIIGVLIALQSIGQLGTHDILVVLPLVVIGYLYSAYAKSAKPVV